MSPEEFKAAPKRARRLGRVIFGTGGLWWPNLDSYFEELEPRDGRGLQARIREASRRSNTGQPPEAVILDLHS